MRTDTWKRRTLLLRLGGLAGVLLASAFLAGVARAAFHRIADLRAANQAVNHTLLVKGEVEGLLSLLIDAETGERGFIITADRKYLEPYDRALASIPMTFDGLRRDTADNTVQGAALAELDPLIRQITDRLQATVAAREQAGGAQTAAGMVASGTLKGLMDSARAIAARMQDEEDLLLAQREAEEEQRARATFATTIAGLGAAILLIAAAGFGLFVVVLRGQRDHAARSRAEAVALAVQQSEESMRVTMMSIGDAVTVTDASGMVTRLNPVAEALTGWKEEETLGRPLGDVLVLINELSRQPAEQPVERVLREGKVVGLANHTLLISRDGREIPIDDSAAPIRGLDGTTTGVVMVFRDITDRRRREREEAARIDGEHARVLSSAERLARMGSWRWQPGSASLIGSQEFHRICGLPENTPLSPELLVAGVDANEREQVQRVVFEAVERKGPFQYRGKIKRPDGSVRILDTRGDVELDPHGNTFLFGFSRDVTEEVQAEDALKEQTDLYEKLVGAQSDAGDGVAITDGAMMIFVNDALAHMYGYSVEDLLAVPSFLDLVAPRERERVVANLRKRMAGESDDALGETRVVRKDGTELMVEYAVKPVQSRGRSLLISIIRDVTERKRAEDSIRQLSHRLLQLQDEEQERIARELQSLVGRTLEVAQARLSSVKESGTVFDWKTSEALRESQDLVAEAAKEVKTLSRLLYPPLLDDAGLAEAIRWYTFDYTLTTRVKVAMDVPVRFPRLGRDAERALYRVVQESLANTARHSGSTTAAVRLRQEAAGIRLEIEDAGSGIPPEILERTRGTVPISGVGIRGMVERLRQLGGTLEIASGPSGTTVCAFLPASAQGLRLEQRSTSR